MKFRALNIVWNPIFLDDMKIGNMSNAMDDKFKI